MTGKPVPVPTPETQPFWDGCAAGELRIQRCADCGRPYFYPRPVCPACGSRNVEWFTASGRATLYSYVINYRPARASRTTCRTRSPWSNWTRGRG